MSNYVENLNDLIVAKNEIKSIIQDAGVEPGDVFSYYPAYIRSAIAGGGTIFDPDDYYTIDYIDENFVSYSYLAETLADIDVDVDLDEYVTYSYAYNTFVSYAYLGDLEQISEYILGSGSSSAPENVYATKSELGAYVSKDLLSTLGYVTSTDLPVINENLIPKESSTYTLGDSSYFYSNSYITNLWTGAKNMFSNRSDNQVNLMLNNGWKYTFHSNGFSPATSNQDLGNVNPWRSTYTSYLYSGNLVLSDGYNSIENVSNTRINFKVNQNNRCKLTNVEFAPVVNNGINLGSSTENFNKAYIGTIFLNGTNLENRFTYLIWTGTSAQYAALDNYTTYQIYMIKES